VHFEDAAAQLASGLSARRSAAPLRHVVLRNCPALNGEALQARRGTLSPACIHVRCLLTSRTCSRCGVAPASTCGQHLSRPFTCRAVEQAN
jgi:hypothetical protein